MRTDGVAVEIRKRHLSNTDLESQTLRQPTRSQCHAHGHLSFVQCLRKMALVDILEVAMPGRKESTPE
jgi:hypothetical protein